MAKPNSSSLFTKMLFLILTTLSLTLTANAAAPVGQTIWIRAAATGLFVSADQNRGTFAPLVADRSTTDAWEQFQVVDAGGGFIAFRSIGTGLFVSADQNRGTWAPLVANRSAVDARADSGIRTARSGTRPGDRPTTSRWRQREGRPAPSRPVGRRTGWFPRPKPAPGPLGTTDASLEGRWR